MASLGEQIHRQQIVVGPGDPDALPFPPARRKIDGRVHGIGGCLVLHVHQVGVQRSRQLRDHRQHTPIPAFDGRQDSDRTVECGTVWLRRPLCSQHTDARPPLLQGTTYFARVGTDSPLHWGIFSGHKQHMHHYSRIVFCNEYPR